MKKIHIIEPTSALIELRDQWVEKIQRAMPDHEVECIGAMSVPMCGKEEIDVLVVSDDVAAHSKTIESLGFKQGPVEKGISYLHTHVGKIEIEAIVAPKDAKMINIHRDRRALLQNDPALRARFESFKRTLDGLDADEYKRRKNEWTTANLP